MLAIIGGFVFWFGGALLFLLLFFNFNKFFYFNSYFLVCFFFLFFLPFLLSHVADRVLVLWQGVRPDL